MIRRSRSDNSHTIDSRSAAFSAAAFSAAFALDNNTPPPNMPGPPLCESRRDINRHSDDRTTKSTYGAILPSNAEVVTLSGYLYFGSCDFADLQALTIRLLNSGAVITRISPNKLLTKSVFTLAPFSYMIGAEVTIHVHSVFRQLNSVKCGANKKKSILCAIYHRHIFVLIENGGLSTTTQPSGYSNRSKSPPG